MDIFRKKKRNNKKMTHKHKIQNLCTYEETPHILMVSQTARRLAHIFVLLFRITTWPRVYKQEITNKYCPEAADDIHFSALLFCFLCFRHNVSLQPNLEQVFRCLQTTDIGEK